MRCRSPRTRPESGFTLTEVMIALTVLIVILVLSMSLLFAMRNFAWRQQVFAEPRQNGRQAVEYVAGNIRSAGITGRVASKFEGLLIPFVYYDSGPGGAVQTQCMWNNVDPAVDGPVADAGTDVICYQRPTGDAGILVDRWPGYQHASTWWAMYDKGCPDDCTNQLMFLQESGAMAYPHMATLVDSVGQVVMVQFSPWQESNPGDPCYPCPRNAGQIQSDCANGDIKVMTNPASLYNPPGGHPELVPPIFIAASQTMTLRVKNGQLQQKLGPVFYDPGDPSSADQGFVPLMENVVDLQFTYYMRSGKALNTSDTNRFPTTLGGRPIAIPDLPDGTFANEYSSSNVLGVGVHLVTRSPAESPFGTKRPPERPWVADNVRPAGYQQDRFFYYATFANAMIRNRTLGF